MQRRPAIIVFSHLRWDFVLQRPQHVLSRMAARYRIFFIEEPVPGSSEPPHWQLNEASPNVTVCRPHTPCAEAGFHDEQVPVLKRMLPELIERHQIESYVCWFYTPMALPLMDQMNPLAVVYDCMDELSTFLGAPPELISREQQLLAKADLVFTGGPSLYRAKKGRHPRVYCFPSSVDAKHFSSAGDGLGEAPDQAALPRPRFGYYGVIDERIDLGLVESIALAHPEWQIVMVGPVAKIDPRTLPRRPNIHYFGQRPYAELPRYLRGWDVCLMPFARNRSTEFISPTKTLEYMAAEKPIVSSPITDVAEPYGDIVYLGSSAKEFIAACEAALEAPSSERTGRRQRMREILNETSWDSTVHSMEQLIAACVDSGRKRSARASSARTVVVGAGPTGLSAAYHLGADSILLEQNSRVGGWCRSIEVGGFTFDYAGHIMFSNDPYVHQLYQLLLGDNVHWQDREAWIYSKNTYTRYPFQGSLYGLPPAVIKDCIMGAIEVRFGPAKNTRRNGANENGTNGVCHAGVKDCCADGILEASAALADPRHRGHAPAAPRNFEEFIYKVRGAGIARHFAIPYNRKLWAVPLEEMETSWLGGRVPLPDLEEMIEGALSSTPKPMGPNSRFGYPLCGGFQALMDAWLPHLQGELRLRTRVVGVSPSRHIVTLSDGTELKYDHLISTMPLPVLMSQIGDDAPAALVSAAAALRHVSVRCVHIGVARERLTDKHWIYYPEDTVFHRIFVQGNASPYCNPPGGFGLTCEITYSPQKPLPCDGDDLVQRCVDDCRRVGLLGPGDAVWAAAQCDLPYAYVVYDHQRAANVAAIREWLSSRDIILAGRYGEWEYYNSDHAFIAGKKAADQIRSMQQLSSNAYVASGSERREPRGPLSIAG